MTDSMSLINLGKLSKPATVLIQKVAGAVGQLWEPAQIRRVARAKAAAAKTRAESAIEISDIQRRASIRVAHEEAIRQENIERITAAAVPLLGADASPENLDEDWLAHFFEKCRIVSDAEMQSLWSRILAGEATHPGRYSKRTLGVVDILGKGDAQLFTRFCSFLIDLGGDPRPFFIPLSAAIYQQAGITYEAVLHLDSLGLIRYSENEGTFIYGLPGSVTAKYFGHEIDVVFAAASDNQLHIGGIVLTQVGRELAPISGSIAIPEFILYLQQAIPTHTRGARVEAVRAPR
jgi:hypothetical protein